MTKYFIKQHEGATEEIWKQLVGYEGHYEVSNKGRVKSISRSIPTCYKSVRTVGETILKQCDYRGYLAISLNVNNKCKMMRVHRAVAEAFIPNPDNKPFVNHIDSNKTNNEVSNLEWVTNGENMDHARKNNRWRPILGQLLPRIPVQQFTLDGKLIATYMNIAAAAKATRVNPDTIKKHIGQSIQDHPKRTPFLWKKLEATLGDVAPEIIELATKYMSEYKWALWRKVKLASDIQNLFNELNAKSDSLTSNTEIK